MEQHHRVLELEDAGGHRLPPVLQLHLLDLPPTPTWACDVKQKLKQKQGQKRETARTSSGSTALMVEGKDGAWGNCNSGGWQRAHGAINCIDGRQLHYGHFTEREAFKLGLVNPIHNLRVGRGEPGRLRGKVGVKVVAVLGRAHLAIPPTPDAQALPKSPCWIHTRPPKVPWA